MRQPPRERPCGYAYSSVLSILSLRGASFPQNPWFVKGVSDGVTPPPTPVQMLLDRLWCQRCSEASVWLAIAVAAVPMDAALIANARLTPTMMVGLTLMPYSVSLPGSISDSSPSISSTVHSPRDIAFSLHNETYRLVGLSMDGSALGHGDALHCSGLRRGEQRRSVDGERRVARVDRAPVVVTEVDVEERLLGREQLDVLSID